MEAGTRGGRAKQKKCQDGERQNAPGEAHGMEFDSLDNYLLDGSGSKAALIEELLKSRAESEEAAPFYRALDILGAKAADEALMALRLVLAGKPAQDESIKRMRKNVAASRKGGDDAPQARDDYFRQVR